MTFDEIRYLFFPRVLELCVVVSGITAILKSGTILRMGICAAITAAGVFACRKIKADGQSKIFNKLDVKFAPELKPVKQLVEILRDRFPELDVLTLISISGEINEDLSNSEWKAYAEADKISYGISVAVIKKGTTIQRTCVLFEDGKTYRTSEDETELLNDEFEIIALNTQGCIESPEGVAEWKRQLSEKKEN